VPVRDVEGSAWASRRLSQLDAPDSVAALCGHQFHPFSIIAALPLLASRQHFVLRPAHLRLHNLELPGKEQQHLPPELMRPQLARCLAAVLFQDEQLAKVNGRAVPVGTLKDLHAPHSARSTQNHPMRAVDFEAQRSIRTDMATPRRRPCATHKRARYLGSMLFKANGSRHVPVGTFSTVAPYRFCEEENIKGRHIMTSTVYVRGFAALTVWMLIGGAALACPPDQYESCFLGACVCLPKVGGDVGRVAEDVKHGVIEPVVNDPVKLIVNPASFINTTGIPTPGDFMEFVIKNPDKGIELLQNPAQWPYLPVAQGMIAGRNAVIANGGQPIPPHLLPFLRQWYSDDLLNSVRWTSNWGPVQHTFQAAQMTFNADTGAITLINAVVFRDGNRAMNGPLWAHELFHVQQYREMGVFGFARQWVSDSSVGGAIEGPAYHREDEALARAPQIPNPPFFPPPDRSVVPPPPPRLNSGAPLSACGCWGYVAPGATRPAQQCSSGVATPVACAGFCPAGGAPWQDVCR